MTNITLNFINGDSVDVSSFINLSLPIKTICYDIEDYINNNNNTDYYYTFLLNENSLYKYDNNYIELNVTDKNINILCINTGFINKDIIHIYNKVHNRAINKFTKSLLNDAEAHILNKLNDL